MSLRTLMQQNAIVYTKTGYNKAGRDVSSNTGISVRCRFENKTKTRINKLGQQISILGTVYLPGDTTINTEDRLEVGGIFYKVFSVNGEIDGRGNQRLLSCEVEKWQTT